MTIPMWFIEAVGLIFAATVILFLLVFAYLGYLFAKSWKR